MPADSDRAPDPASAPPAPDWDRIERTPEYRELRRMQTRFLVPATVVYLAGYFGFLVLAAAGPGFFGHRLHGGLNGGMLLMFAAYLMVWLLVGVYIRTARRRFDPKAAEVRALADASKPGASEPSASKPSASKPGASEPNGSESTEEAGA